MIFEETNISLKTCYSMSKMAKNLLFKYFYPAFVETNSLFETFYSMSSSEKQNETLILLSFNLTSLKENIILKRSSPEIFRISCTLFTCPFSH
jgi:hypothetical protein